MANIKVVDKAVVLVSSVKLEDIKRLEKYNSKALCLMGGEDNKEVIFKIGSAEKPSVNEYGVCFTGESTGENGGATVTVIMDNSGLTPDQIKEAIAEKFGAALVNLSALEETIPAALEKVAADRESVIAQIEVVI